jgi:hypothetical protein
MRWSSGAVRRAVSRHGSRHLHSRCTCPCPNNDNNDRLPAAQMQMQIQMQIQMPIQALHPRTSAATRPPQPHLAPAAPKPRLPAMAQCSSSVPLTHAHLSRVWRPVRARGHWVGELAVSEADSLSRGARRAVGACGLCVWAVRVVMGGLRAGLCRVWWCGVCVCVGGWVASVWCAW